WWRKYDIVEPRTARLVSVAGGRPIVQVCSTQYLALQWRDDVERALKSLNSKLAIKDWGTLGSNFLLGTHPVRVGFERWLAKEMMEDDAAACASGWAACYATAESLSKLCQTLVIDVRCHNSVLRGAQAGKAEVLRCDMKKVDVQSII